MFTYSLSIQLAKLTVTTSPKTNSLCVYRQSGTYLCHLPKIFHSKCIGNLPLSQVNMFEAITELHPRKLAIPLPLKRNCAQATKYTK